MRIPAGSRNLLKHYAGGCFMECKVKNDYGTIFIAEDVMLKIDLYIIVEYGISISEVCKTIVETVRYKLESTTGVKVRKVSISVEGIRI